MRLRYRLFKLDVVDYAERELWLTLHLDTRIALIWIDSPCRL